MREGRCAGSAGSEGTPEAGWVLDLGCVRREGCSESKPGAEGLATALFLFGGGQRRSNHRSDTLRASAFAVRQGQRLQT